MAPGFHIFKNGNICVATHAFKNKCIQKNKILYMYKNQLIKFSGGDGSHFKVKSTAIFRYDFKANAWNMCKCLGNN